MWKIMAKFSISMDKKSDFFFEKDDETFTRKINCGVSLIKDPITCIKIWEQIAYLSIYYLSKRSNVLRIYYHWLISITTKRVKENLNIKPLTLVPSQIIDSLMIIWFQLSKFSTIFTLSTRQHLSTQLLNVNLNSNFSNSNHSFCINVRKGGGNRAALKSILK